MTEQEWQEWEKAANQYQAVMEIAVAQGTAKHAGCDHANGYCAETPDNIYEGVK